MNIEWKLARFRLSFGWPSLILVKKWREKKIRSYLVFSSESTHPNYYESCFLLQKINMKLTKIASQKYYFLFFDVRRCFPVGSQSFYILHRSPCHDDDAISYNFFDRKSRHLITDLKVLLIVPQKQFTTKAKL